MWYKVENGSSTKPPVTDTTSSKVYNYIRKDFVLIPEEGDRPEHWEWKEQKIPKTDWELFTSVMGHSEALDDVYAALTELAEMVVG